MKTDATSNPVSNGALWTGRTMSALAVIFLLFDSITKIIKVQQVMDATLQLGFPVNLVPVIGSILLISTILYVIPSTSVFGAILLTGYLGGAVVTNMRIESPLFSHTLFPVYMGILIWGGIYLRVNTLHRLIPFTRQ